MPYTVRIAHQQRSFLVEETETILDAALRQDFDIPHSCCSGICGSCEGQVIDGVIHYDHTDDLVLDEEARAQGRALFCSAKARSDLLIDVPGIGLPSRNVLKTYAYVPITLSQLTPDLYQASLTPLNHKLSYIAGQYVNIQLPEQDAKPFSIANAPEADGRIELHIRVQPDNIFAKELIRHLQSGEKLILEGPCGNCFYHPNPHMPSIFLAVGSGFAPLKAILEESFKNPSPHEIALFWAGKHPEDLYQIALPQQWEKDHPNFQFIPILASAEKSLDWPGIYGNIVGIVSERHPNLAQHHVYFGGPMQLTLDGLEHFVAQGAQTCYMYSDVFDFL